ncbi:hypothetical protein LSAT2_015770 [Lamellibrachia satsuma]|nr:hypothetical protein LSAT2_015770 [Lamellibrachia satsuma]
MKTSFVVFTLIMLLVAISGAQASDYGCTGNGGICQDTNVTCGVSYKENLCDGGQSRQCCFKPYQSW